MSDFKILVDTNVVIGLEDPQPVLVSLSELVRLSSEHAVGLFVEGANYDDVARDKDVARRAVTLSKLAKFQQLRDVPVPDNGKLIARFGPTNSENDWSDVRLLAALDAKAVDFLVTQDVGLHRRAERAGLGTSVLTVDEALEWLKQTFTAVSVSLPYVEERKAYQINPDDAIFSSLRADYPGFDKWFDNCRRQHRVCWVLEIGNKIAGLVIRKEENHFEARTQHLGPKILKICTFKVEDEFQGEKFGELLLKQVLWFVQSNDYDLTYVTAFPKHAFLIDLLGYYGFCESRCLANGEIMLEKPILKGTISSVAGNIFDFDRAHYPRFYDGQAVHKFCVPIRPDYHRRLFPEIAFAKELPLFPQQTFGLILDRGQERTPGNTIRKVYLCRAKTQQLRPGDLLFFYMSKDDSYAHSQSITTVGIVERVIDVSAADDLIRHTAKRSVFTAEDLRAMGPSVSSPVKMIDFLLVGHVYPPVGLNALISNNVFLNRPPQSITQLDENRYTALKPCIQLGFEL
jgi:ribosomal protein S18 acetylase RimI-like enzyme